MSHELCLAEGHSLRGARLQYCAPDGRSCYVLCRCGRPRQIPVWQWEQAGHRRVRWRVRSTEKAMDNGQWTMDNGTFSLLHSAFSIVYLDAFTRSDALHQVQGRVRLTRDGPVRVSRVREGPPSGGRRDDALQGYL